MGENPEKREREQTDRDGGKEGGGPPACGKSGMLPPKTDCDNNG